MKVRLGIDLGGTFIKAGIINDDFKIVTNFRHPSDADKNPDAVKKNIKSAFQKLLDKCNKKGYKPISAGIGSPGTIRQPDGKVTDASPNIKGWQGVVLTEIVDNGKIPFYADNDANCVALAEYLVGFDARYDNMIFVTVGTGIGGGLIIENRLHRGSNYAAAELGHTVVKYNGRKCGCGRRGCLEAYASVPNLMKRAHYWASKEGKKLPLDISPEKLYEMYENGNRIAKLTIKENTEYLGAGIGSFVNTLNPEIVAIGGGFSASGKDYIQMIDREIRKHAFKEATRKLKVMKAKMGNKAGFVGAALLGLVDKENRITKK
jgi:glucokinase